MHFECPKCKTNCGYVKSRRVIRGWYTTHHKPDGEVEEFDSSSVKYGKEPKTVTCKNCSKRVENPDL